MTLNNPTNIDKVSEPGAAARIFGALLELEQEQDREKEHFWIMGLKSSNAVKFIELITLGTLDASLVHPREVMRPLIINCVANFIIGHNHPSGERRPSEEDRLVTERLKQVGLLLGIRLLDHVIITKDGYFSFQEEEIL